MPHASTCGSSLPDARSVAEVGFPVVARLGIEFHAFGSRRTERVVAAADRPVRSQIRLDSTAKLNVLERQATSGGTCRGDPPLPLFALATLPAFRGISTAAR